jgi:hypothetical protein
MIPLFIYAHLVHVAISPMTYFPDRPRPRSFRKTFDDEDDDEAECDGSARICPCINDRVYLGT